ncbi:hypothetical protein [Roseisolibacter sp. H3M3-2]|uniref:hypothetical protein n=1 Tax=Roseisolibacter sp. H3M3-2 TaxID=3031323 RepID=UPI0023DAAA95|nr:hypothetical protein [Roseisolibacter sp. H3M3-2]MDF1504600.1 hypothetical protein [Roseisolibacter sp. H3M3-2]
MAPSRRLRAAAPIVVPLAALLLACDDGVGGPSDGTRVRARNTTGVELRNVVLRFPGEERLAAARLPAGATTGHVAVRTAYRYAYVEAEIAGRRTVLQPIDYVGERPLGAGCFTYDLTLTPGGESLGIAARPDPDC